MLASLFTSKFPNRQMHERGKIVFGLDSKRRVPENTAEPEILVSVQGVQFKRFETISDLLGWLLAEGYDLKSLNKFLIQKGEEVA